MGYTDCSGYVAQALSLGITQGEIDAFKAANTNSDGTWDCHRLLDAFGGLREQQTTVGTPAARVVAAIAAATPLPPPIVAQGTASGDARMFLTMDNVPTGTGSGAPARELATYGGGVLQPASSAGLSLPGGLNLTTILIVLAIVGAAWYLTKK